MIYQFALCLLTAISVHLSLSPPNPPVKRQDCRTDTPGTNTLFEHGVQYVTFLSKASVWFFTCSNIIGTISSQGLTLYPCAMSKDATEHNRGSIHPFLVVGMVLTCLSAILRLWCYRTLGHLFTFEITIRPKHELVTYGPYAFVRHPSYTGVYLTLSGATLVLLAPDTWTVEHGIRTPIGAFLLFLWLLKCAFAFRGTATRLRSEDELLRATFGEEWELYAKRVPYRLVPWVY
ncbi:putative protein-S-isoprenylcysteine O-methyltransferase [Leucoagaricus sp. SymC.cos]|nr:putative protein-S-isoprenylcysteine O-methyltransferase [Leucoagaricus sp. SymC.cos]